jgi:hypothetical protein
MGAGVSKLYFDNHVDHPLFWIGIVGLIVFAVLFIMIAKYMHKKIDELEEL